mgnify:CR=1 FL=1
MSELRSEKYVNSLPGVLTANTIYYVKNGAGFDVHITNNSGTIIAYPLNTAAPSSGLTFQEVIRIKTILNNI